MRNLEDKRAYNRRYHDEHRAEQNAKRRERYARNKDALCAQTREYRKNNPDKVREWDRSKRERNRERVRESQRRWQEANRERISGKNRFRKTGFTPQEFAEAIEKQGGRCAICQTDLRSLKPLHVHADHCHATGEKRGVLCTSCNQGLGRFKDDAERLRAAIAYLESPPLSLA